MKWEYRTIKLDPNSFFVEETPSLDASEIDKFINQLGHRGWELVSTEGIIGNEIGVSTAYTKTVVLFFKRPVTE